MGNGFRALLVPWRGFATVHATVAASGLCQIWHIMEAVLDKPNDPRKLIWLADSLDRLARFPWPVRHMLGFALYQAQIGQTHESAKILRQLARKLAGK
jgi:hypothetical protein